ncbi:MAG: hypothetical protein HC912_05220 [Saprospiraceae bacterium]|nr:hypothetical protein [Saprospiraceae bacterium]
MEQIDKQIESMVLLRKAMRQENRWQLFTALLLLIVGAALSYFFFNQQTLLSILGLVGVLVGARLTHLFFHQLNVDETKLMRLLHHQPEKIVWVYSVITARSPFGFQLFKHGLLYFMLLDGDNISVSLPSAQLKIVSEGLNGMLPHATFGYTKEREAFYQKAPERLLRKADN